MSCKCCNPVYGPQSNWNTRKIDDNLNPVIIELRTTLEQQKQINKADNDALKLREEQVASLKAALGDALDALNGVVAVADRQTKEFDAARAVIARIQAALSKNAEQIPDPCTVGGT